MNKILNALFLVAFFTFLTSCTDDQENSVKRLDGYIYFNVKKNSQWADDKNTRSLSDSPMLLECDLDNAQPLYLHTTITPTASQEIPGTRGNRLTGEVIFDATISQFGVYGIAGSNSFMEGFAISSMETDGEWRTQEYDANGNWPDGNTATFYAYAPYFEPNAATNSNGLRVYNDAGQPKIEYTVPTEGANQIDLLTAKDAGVNKGEDVELVFDHILSAIKFYIKNTKTTSDTDKGDLTWSDGINTYYVTISDVAINNVYSKGTWNVGDQVYATSPATDPANTWVTDGTKGSSTIHPNVDLNGKIEPAEVNPDNSGNVFMMIPQITPTGATLKITCTMTRTDNPSISTTVAFTTSIAGKTWLPGYTYEYRLSLSDMEYVFQRTNNVGTGGSTDTYTTTYTGETFENIYITSYKTNNGTNKARVDWKAYYQPFDGATWIPAPAGWVHLKDATETEVTTAAHTGAFDDDATRIFKLVVDPFTFNNMDLSLYSIDKKSRITRSTANCYVVTNPGTYRIPLIYGNAVKNGTANESSYKVRDDFSSLLAYLSTFLNYQNEAITSPYIVTDVERYSKPITDAVIVWQDVDNLVTSPSIEWTNTEEDTYNGTTLGYLKFTVDPTNMSYGNSVVAIRDSEGTIVWSWHIWVTNPTNFLTSPKSTTRDGVTYSFAGDDMGWITPADVTLDPREIKIKLVQEESANELIFTVHQDNLSFTAAYRNVLYQWGRKDAFPGNTPDNTNITVYNGSFSAVTNSSVTTAMSIQNPGIQYVNSSGTFWANTYRNRWNMNSTATLSTTSFQGKTIYDPCPIGYRVPPSAAFQNFSITSVTPITINGILYGRIGSNFYLPIVGYRDGEHDGGAHPVEWQRLAYYQHATCISNAENNMVRMRYYPITNNIVGDDTHRGDQNRACSVRAVIEPDSDVEIVENNPFSLKPDDGTRPEESLARENKISE